MATTFTTGAAQGRAEERFFFKLACAIALVLVAGFSVHLAMGRSSFDAPLLFHLHGVVFFGWVGLFLVQTGLMAGGNVALHKRLGWLSALWVPLMVVLGFAITLASLRRNGGPFFFDANEFLFGNPAGILAFATLVGAAVALRKRTDWHRRLMLGAMASIAGPGFGRLLPMPLMIPYAWELSNLICMGFVVAGMIRDKRHHGAVHPAWLAALIVPLVFLTLGQIIAYSPWGIELTRQVLEGHPGAVRPMAAYLP
ncbi:MAG: hypothetical protein J0L50_05215 [Sphingomonadales bacterium]|nr:hypothetical protein [Sphingomonadales bacterium]